MPREDSRSGPMPDVSIAKEMDPEVVAMLPPLHRLVVKTVIEFLEERDALGWSRRHHKP